ncbi:MAG: carbohydrate ABC transporter permease [Clostridia bacterium]|nr:carbohydrate ABC transporter permease [Clostridia bacterium]
MRNPFKKSIENESPAWNISVYTILTIVALVSLFPILNVVSKSFSTVGKEVVFLPQGITWFNWGYVLAESAFYRAFGVSVLVTLFGTLLSVGFMFMAAYPLSKKDLPFRKGFMMFFMVVMLFSGGIVPNFVVMTMLGLTNTPFALVIPSLVQVYNMILLKNNLEGVPAEIEESARIDGAGNMVILVQILLPICIPSIASVALFTAVTYWNNYFNALLYISPMAEELYPLAMYILNRIKTAADVDDMTVLNQKTYIDAAMIVISMLPIVCAYPFVLKFFVGGLTVGSVKG